MKKARDDKPISTIPKGAYESGVIQQDIRKNHHINQHDKGMDAQGNGYPDSDPEKDRNRS